jgi:predicted AlkP superfamily pyrophosphatase or phosphodiesterase
VSFDGLRPDAIGAANMVNLQALMQGGAYSLSARTILPSTTLPAHASMLTGTCPSKHIVRWNEYVPQNGYALGTDLFDLAHAAGLRTVMVVGKEKLRQITEPASTDFFQFVDDTDKISDPNRIEQLAIQQIGQGFSLMFVHFPNGDLAGHEYGWLSRKQLETYTYDDESLGYILETLKARGMYAGTLVLVTADHGGHETTHGGALPEDMTIPWIASGPGVLPLTLPPPVHIMDTAATAAFALGLPIPAEWDGVPVFEAFGLPASASTDC